MIVLNGKYNFAKVFLPNESEEVLVHEAVDDADENEYKTVYTQLGLANQLQIESFLNHPGFRERKIRVMPDTHAGKGSCVGFTMDLGDIVIPNIIGVDIGCGMTGVKLPIKYFAGMSFDTLDEYIRKNIPAGFNINLGATPEKYGNHFMEEVKDVCISVGMDFNRAVNSIGSLGGGNHFIELGKDEEDFLWLTIHSGSRNFGLQVAKFWQKQADDLCKAFYQDFGDLNFMPKYYWGYQQYLDGMQVAQQYAHANRFEMMSRIVYGYFHREPVEIIDSVHNYIAFDEDSDDIIRKGATSARLGEKLIIPFNMEDGLIIGTGKGNSDWNNSAPHGAGRILSRGQAKKLLSLDVAKEGMKNAGVFTTSLSADTLDEAKAAYKSTELITEMIKDTVEITHWVRPVYNFKAGEKTE